MTSEDGLGPLAGVRVLEFVGLGPAPFACMLLADLGAEVIAIHRPGAQLPALLRGRSTIELDLKSGPDRARAADLAAQSDILVEGFRPGVMERLGLGPDDLLLRNAGLIYARMTGWGQDGPRAMTAGHDINYIAPTGALHLATRAGDVPVPPANLLGDFGGGAMYLVTSVLAALYRRDRTGAGAVLDVAIVDGVNYLTSMQHEYRARGAWSDEAGTNRLDTGAPYYDVYPCADGGFVAVGALEPQFFAELADLLGLDPSVVAEREDPQNWPALRAAIAAAILTRTRDEWDELARNTNACLTGVLSLAESAAEPHVAARTILRRNADGSWTPLLSRSVTGPPRVAQETSQPVVDSQSPPEHVGANNAGA
ncbi:MAG: CaiB/BaiF CoA-transferase family protein [Gordonia sp. (in: high G+C Gram-positive bacteria)]